METIMKTVLLLAVLCLAGCKSEDPQSVAFEFDTINVGTKEQPITVKVTANCQWTLSSNSSSITIHEDYQSSGNSTIHIVVSRNLTYDNITHQIMITSEDGSSSDVLSIYQEANLGLEVKDVGLLSEEGGTFTVPVKTNDKIIEVKTPEWITFTSSRALSEYSYTFTADQNKTRATRKDYIFIVGENLSARIDVQQNSYALDSAWVNLPVCVLRDTSDVYPIHTIPEYADLSRLSVVKSNHYIGARIEEDRLCLSYFTPETDLLQETSLQLCLDGKIIQEHTIGIVKPKIYISSNRYMHYPGENFYISSLQEPYGIWEITNPDVISKLEDGRFRAMKNGTCTINVTSLANGYTASKVFTVYDVALDSKMFSISNPHDDLWYVTFHSTARGRGITQNKMYITLPGSTEEVAVQSGYGDKNVYSLNYNPTILLHGHSRESIMDIVRYTKLHFEGIVDGKKVSTEVYADVQMERD